MKKKTFFELDINIRPSLKKKAKKSGRDLNWYVNELLKNCLGPDLIPMDDVILGYRPEKEEKFTKTTSNIMSNEISTWLQDNLVLDAKTNKAQYLTMLFIKFPEMKRWLSPKQFSLWLDQYAERIGASILKGKDKDHGRWIVIYSPGKKAIA